MKDYYLSYNELTKHYYLDLGAFDRNRVDFGVCGEFGILEKKLKESLSFHRKSSLFVDKNFPIQHRESLKDLLIKTQIKVLFNQELK